MELWQQTELFNSVKLSRRVSPAALLCQSLCSRSSSVLRISGPEGVCGRQIVLQYSRVSPVEMTLPICPVSLHSQASTNSHFPFPYTPGSFFFFVCFFTSRLMRCVRTKEANVVASCQQMTPFSLSFHFTYSTRPLKCYDQRSGSGRRPSSARQLHYHIKSSVFSSDFISGRAREPRARRRRSCFNL